MGHNPASPVIRVVIAALMASGLGACGQSKAAGPGTISMVTRIVGRS